MNHVQAKPMYYDGSGTIQLPQTKESSQDIIIKPVGVIIKHVQVPYFPY